MNFYIRHNYIDGDVADEENSAGGTEAEPPSSALSTAIRKGMCEAATAGIADPTKERLGSAIPIVAAGLE